VNGYPAGAMRHEGAFALAEYKPIVIACPQYRKLVRGEYACGPDGKYLLGPGGEFVLGRVRCGHNGGRCMATLCALHRYNRRGPGTWYPGRVAAASPAMR